MAIAGATEACVNRLALSGFDRMRALCRDNSSACSRPFDVGRSGFVLSEGAGLIFMERLEDALERGAPIQAEVMGYGVSSDCYHISSPHPSGIGARLSMQRAIQDSSLDVTDVQYVNAHATSTPTGDAIEGRAIRDLFLHHPVNVSSIKGHIGHLLAAAGAVEVIETVSCLRDSLMPSNLNTTEVEAIDGINILTQNTPWAVPSSTGARRTAIVNSFGFGGTNASLVLAEYVPSTAEK